MKTAIHYCLSTRCAIHRLKQGTSEFKLELLQTLSPKIEKMNEKNKIENERHIVPTCFHLRR